MSAEPVAIDIDPKRKKIIEAAERLFIANGYVATTMEGVAAATRASKRTIYARFSSKEDLFTAVMLAACRGIKAPLLDPAEILPLEAALQAAGRATLYRVLQPRGLAVLGAAIGARTSVPDIMRVYWENGPGLAHAYVKQAIARAHAKGRYRSVSSAAAASRFTNMIFGPFLYGVLFAGEKLPSRARMDEALDDSIKEFLRWLLAASESQGKRPA